VSSSRFDRTFRPMVTQPLPRCKSENRDGQQAKAVHNLETVTEEVVEKVRQVVRDE